MRTIEVGDDWFVLHRLALLDWLRANWIDPDGVYQVDVDDWTCTVYEFDRDENRQFYLDPDGDIAEREPYTVLRTTIERPWFSAPLALPLPSP